MQSHQITSARPCASSAGIFTTFAHTLHQTTTKMSYMLQALKGKNDIDQAIMGTVDKILVLRFGKEDDMLAKAQREVSKMAVIYTIDAAAVPLYLQYFDVTLIPATLFFFNTQHMKVDYGTQDHTKFIGSFQIKQDFIDLIEVIYKGAIRGKHIVDSPIPPSRVPQYQLIYKDI